MLGILGAQARAARASLRFTAATVAFGVRGPLNLLLSELAHFWTKLRVFSAHTGLSRMVEIVLDIETRRLAVKAVAGLGVMAVVAIGVPQLEKAAERQAEDHAWRMKARALVEFDPESSAAAAPAISRLAGLHWTEDAVNDRAAVNQFQTFAPVHFRTAEEQHIDVDCLSRAIYYEARSESVRGQLAVAEVVMNRVTHRLYPNNICGVVYEGTDRGTGLSWRGNQESCQFSFTCDGSEARRPPEGQQWAQAQRIAAHAMMGLSTSVTGEATHYHASYVSPHWAPRLVHTQTIGAHIFYRFPRGKDEGPRRGA